VRTVGSAEGWEVEEPRTAEKGCAAELRSVPPTVEEEAWGTPGGMQASHS